MDQRNLRARTHQEIHPSGNAVPVHQGHHVRAERTPRNVGVLKILESVNQRNLALPAQLIIVSDLTRDLVAVDEARRIVREMYDLVTTGDGNRRTRR